MLALGGRIPLGYYKDDAKTAATFRTIDGVRYSVPGDFAQVDADGTIHLLGRGRWSSTPAARRSTPRRWRRSSRPSTGVADAVVVGIPDDRFGEEIVAVVELDPGPPPESVSAETVIDHVKARLAGYKAPRRVHFVATIGRSPGGQGRLRPAPGGDGRLGRRSLGLSGPSRTQPLLAPCVRTKSLTA